MYPRRSSRSLFTVGPIARLGGGAVDGERTTAGARHEGAGPPPSVSEARHQDAFATPWGCEGAWSVSTARRSRERSRGRDERGGAHPAHGVCRYRKSGAPEWVTTRPTGRWP